MLRAFVDEIFSSVQGEGILVGRRQIFVRFHGCTLRCQYCDTPASMGQPGFCSVERTPGKRDMSLVQNPFTPRKLTRSILQLKKRAKKLHAMIALTGGEPLEQVEFLVEWLPEIKKHFRIFLETNGIYPLQLSQVIRYIDSIGMDIKLPSSTAQRGFWEEHERFLKCAKKKDVFVKIVITADTDKFELLKAGLLISKIDGQIPLVLQPVDPAGAARGTPSPAQLFDYQELLSDLLNDVRIIPQVHKLCSFP